jgi:hypothetical protein
MRRWHEDIVLVEEEMRRTIEYGRWMATQWETRVTARQVDSPALAEGIRAYALEHARREKDTCDRLVRQWVGLREKARAYLAGAKEPGADVVIDLDADEDTNDPEGDVQGEEVIDLAGEQEEDEEDPDEV